MKLLTKSSVIAVAVLMFSFMNMAQAANCSGNGVSFCNASTTKSSCLSTYRITSPGMQCAWNGTICSASGSSCDTHAHSDGENCKTDGDCMGGTFCAGNICASIDKKKPG
jgi:hypothetical protein